MATVAAQGTGLVVFAAGTLVLARRVRRDPGSGAAGRCSRVGHALFYLCLCLPQAVALVRPGVARFDGLLGLPPLPFPAVARVLGVACLLPGVFCTVSSVLSLRRLGGGLPAFALTSRVVAGGAYARVRNPMSLGYYLVAVGVGLAFRSTYWTAYAAAGVVPAHMLYLRLFEEAELERRHGSAYLRYKSATPFIVPALLRRRTR